MKKLIGMTAIATTLALVPAIAAADTAAAADRTKCFGKEATILGTNGDDVIRGTRGQDVIKAYGGDDVIYGFRGNDFICAGGGDDTVYASKGNDKVWGGGGDDTIFGGQGNDVMYGVWGNDSFFGNAGTDVSREGARWGETHGVEVPRTIPVRTGMVHGATLRVKGANSGKEIYLGVPDLGNGANRNEGEYEGLESGGGTAPVEFAWDPAENQLRSDVDGVVTVYDFDTENPPACSPDDWDIMEVLLRTDSTAATFENATFNGHDMNPVTNGVFSSDRGYAAWTNGPKAVVVMDVDFERAWTVSGDLVATGDFDGNERNKLEISVGCKTHADRALDS